MKLKYHYERKQLKDLQRLQCMGYDVDEIKIKQLEELLGFKKDLTTIYILGNNLILN